MSYLLGGVIPCFAQRHHANDKGQEREALALIKFSDVV